MEAILYLVSGVLSTLKGRSAYPKLLRYTAFNFCSIRIVPLKLFSFVNESINPSTFVNWAETLLIKLNNVRIKINLFINDVLRQIKIG
ncbi:hypothetical protein D3C86_2013370 [compost metagenome]